MGSGWDRVVVLERLARGGGATRWYLIRSREDIERVFEMFRGGSSVSFYFADQLHVEVDTESARQRMFDELSAERELVAGYPSDSDPELDLEIISGPGELASYLISHSEGQLIVWGKWPGRDNDGRDAITINLFDEDGILRAHPH
jgi:hypothetical protein